jgi:hypothetical protein
MTPEARMGAFLALSEDLTAFRQVDLLGTGQAHPYLDAIVGVVGEGIVDELLDAYERVRASAVGGDRTAALRRELLSDEKLGPIARNVIKLWFVGIWYELPGGWRDSFGMLEGDFTFMVSPEAYTEGLLWPTIGANPNGAKAPGYGSWAQPPQIPAV